MSKKQSFIKKSQRSREAWAKWRKLVAEQAKSGQNVAVFCRERGLCAPHFFAWKKKLSATAGAKLVEVKLATGPEANQSSSGLAVALANGRTIQVAAGFQGAELLRLVSLLERM